jgi:hypothetical protein
MKPLFFAALLAVSGPSVQQVVEAAPGMSREVWMSNGAAGLYRNALDYAR